MKILLINPNSKFISSHRLYRRFLPPVAPLGLAYIAAVLEADGIKVSIVDMFANEMSDKEVLNIIRDAQPQIVGFSVLTPVVNDVMSLIKQVRNMNKEIKIVLGNTYPSYFPNQFLERGLADIIVRGEGEAPMLGICRALRSGGDLTEVKGISYSFRGDTFHNPNAAALKDLDNLPYPAFHLLDLGRYKDFPLLSIYNSSFLPISASRGCAYRCYFCSQDGVSKSPRYRAVKSVVDEMEYFQQRFNTKYLCFTDAYFPFSESTGLEFCGEIAQRKLSKKIKWITESRVDKVSKKLLKEMKKAGLALIMYGVEVGNQEVLNRINKKTTLEQARQALRYTREAGILSLGLYILGLPGETAQTCGETVRFARELDSDIAKFNIAIPYPGSQFFKDSMGDKRIENPEKYTSWYSAFSMNSEKIPSLGSNLSYRDLTKLQRKAMISYYIRPKIILRYFCRGIVSYKLLFYGAYWLLSMLFLKFLDICLCIIKKNRN